MPDPKKLQALEKIAKKAKEKYGDDFFFFSLREGEKYLLPEAVPTGILGLDIATNLGGIPRGRAIEFYGPESGGKTTMALAVAAAFQRQGLSVLYVDAENSLSLEHIRFMGVQEESFYVAQPASGEVALNLIRDVVSEGLMDLVILDSIPALAFQRELDGSAEDQHMAVLARYMTQLTRFLNAYLNRHKITILFINQVRDQIGANPKYGPAESTPGGRAVKHFSSLRLSIRKGSTIRQGGKDGPPIGHTVKVKVEKSKFGPPRSFDINLYYGKGFDLVTHLVETAKLFGVLERSGAWIVFGERRFHGMAQFAEYLAAEPGLAEEIRQQVLQVALSSGENPLNDTPEPDDEEDFDLPEPGVSVPVFE